MHRMNISSPTPQANERKSLRMQLLVLIGLAAFAFIIAWFDGLRGLSQAAQTILAGQEVVMVRTQWYITFSLPLVSVVALVMASIAHYRQQLFDMKTMVISGAVVVGAVIVISVSALLGADSWIEAQHYERCTSLDRVQGVTRHGSRNVQFAAWTPIGQCR